MTGIRPLIAISLVLAGTARCAATDPVVVVALGDSITKGVRSGVKETDTFAALLGERLNKDAGPVRVVNVGVGGERTDGALARLQKDVLPLKPRVVLVMYGTNDSYVDHGKTESRLSVRQYEKNLVALIDTLRKHGAEPVLMTEPRWAPGAKNGLGENPNDRLAEYMVVCRDAAKANKVALVDHFAHWTAAEKKGTALRDWTTDGCHPNPRGHEQLADAIEPVLRKVLKADPPK